MPTNRRSIGSQGLEQGGPDLGNDYSTPPRTTGNGTDIPVTDHLNRNRTDNQDENGAPVYENEDEFEEEEPDYEEEDI